MKAALERPGPPACTAWSAKSPSSVRAGTPRCPKDLTDIGMKGRAEDTCRNARRLEASRAAAAKPGMREAPPAKDAAAGWMTETSPTTSRRGNMNMTSPRAPDPREGRTPRGSGSGRGFQGQERGQGRPAAPERPLGPAQGRQGRAPGGQKHSLPNRGRARVQRRGQRGARTGLGISEKGLRRVVDTSPSSNTAPTGREKVVARRLLQGEAGASERVIGVALEDVGPAVAPEDGGVCRPGWQAQAEASGRGQVRVRQGKGEGGGHGVQPDGSWSACTGVKASTESGAFEQGRSGGQQVREPLARKVLAELPLGAQEDQGQEGRVERLKLRGPEAGRRVMKRRPPSDEHSTVGACAVERPKQGRHGPHSHVGRAGRCHEGSVSLEGGGEP
jgi:hypothetical protein